MKNIFFMYCAALLFLFLPAKASDHSRLNIFKKFPQELTVQVFDCAMQDVFEDERNDNVQTDLCRCVFWKSEQKKKLILFLGNLRLVSKSFNELVDGVTPYLISKLCRYNNIAQFANFYFKYQKSRKKDEGDFRSICMSSLLLFNSHGVNNPEHPIFDLESEVGGCIKHDCLEQKRVKRLQSAYCDNKLNWRLHDNLSGCSKTNEIIFDLALKNIYKVDYPQCVQCLFSLDIASKYLDAYSKGNELVSLQVAPSLFAVALFKDRYDVAKRIVNECPSLLNERLKRFDFFWTINLGISCSNEEFVQFIKEKKDANNSFLVYSEPSIFNSWQVYFKKAKAVLENPEKVT